MPKPNLLVLMIRDLIAHPDHETNVMDVSDAIERLKEEGLVFKVDSLGKRWGIKGRNGKYIPANEKDVGKSHTFAVDGLQRATYVIGIYDRTNTDHMQAMIETAIYQEGKRHRAYSMD